MTASSAPISHHHLTPASEEGSVDPRRILIADDYEPTRVLLRTLIEHEGMQVVGEAEDGSEAVALALRHEPDVVLLDVKMPRLDGLGAAEIIRASRPRIRLLLHTSEPLETAVERAAALRLTLADKRDLHLTIQQLGRLAATQSAI
jgi:CheY-like chemotaxis protein